jgi:hypothetical protein
MAASDYVPIFFKNRLHLAGRPQMGSRPSTKRDFQRSIGYCASRTGRSAGCSCHPPLFLRIQILIKQLAARPPAGSILSVDW